MKKKIQSSCKKVVAMITAAVLVLGTSALLCGCSSSQSADSSSDSDESEMTGTILAGSEWPNYDHPTYHITYYGNGNTTGTVPAEPTTVSGGTYVTILDNTNGLATQYDDFSKWNTKPDGSGDYYWPGQHFTIDRDLELYAIYGYGLSGENAKGQTISYEQFLNSASTQYYHNGQVTDAYYGFVQYTVHANYSDAKGFIDYINKRSEYTYRLPENEDEFEEWELDPDTSLYALNVPDCKLWSNEVYADEYPYRYYASNSRDWVYQHTNPNQSADDCGFLIVCP